MIIKYIGSVCRFDPYATTSARFPDEKAQLERHQYTILASESFIAHHLNQTTMKILAILIPVLTFGFQTYSQQGFYLKAGAGYAFAVPPESFDINEAQIYLREFDPQTGNYVPAVIHRFSEVKGSGGAGFNTSLAAGYKFSEYLGIELTGVYSPGKEYKATTLYQEVTDGNVMLEADQSRYFRVRSFILSPALILTAPSDNFKPYASVGIVFNKSKVSYETVHKSNYPDETPSAIINEEYTGGTSLGLRAALGMDIRLSDHLFLFCEIVMNNLNYYPKEKEIVKYMINSEDQLPRLTTRQRVTTFVKDYATDTRIDGYNDTDIPSEQTRMSFYMGNLSANAGVKLFF